MTSLLEGPISDIAFAAANFILLDAVYHVETPGVHDPATGLTGAGSVVDHPCRGFVEASMKDYVDRGIITEGERAVLIFQRSLSVVPVPGQSITIRGIRSVIQDVGEDDGAEVLWVLGVSP